MKYLIDTGRIIDHLKGFDKVIRGDIKTGLVDLYKALDRLMSGAERKAVRMRTSALAKAKAPQQEVMLERTRQVRDQKPMDPVRFFPEMKEVLPRDAIIVDEAVTSTLPLLRTMAMNEPGSFFSISGGSRGWGIGGALGVKLAVSITAVCVRLRGRTIGVQAFIAKSFLWSGLSARIHLRMREAM